MSHLNLTPPEAIKVTEIIDNVRYAAKLLSDAIKQANALGVNVSVQANPDEKPNLIQIIYSV